MSAYTGRFQPGLVTALVKIALISTWQGRTFLDDDLRLDDVAGFVPDETPSPVRLAVTASTGPSTEQPTAAGGHSVAA